MQTTFSSAHECASISINFIVQDSFANITDYSQMGNCPKGFRTYYPYADFTDSSHCLCDFIFAPNRAVAFGIAIAKFADCAAYLKGINLYSQDGED